MSWLFRFGASWGCRGLSRLVAGNRPPRRRGFRLRQAWTSERGLPSAPRVSTFPSACVPSPEVSRAFRQAASASGPALARTPLRTPAFLHPQGEEAARRAGILACHFRSQSTKTRRSVTLKQNNPMLLYFNHLHPSTRSQRPEKPGPACYNKNRKSQGTNVLTKEERQKVNSATALTEYAGETPGGARLQTCRVAIRDDMSWRHDHSPTSAPSQPSLDLSGGERGAKSSPKHTNSTNRPRFVGGTDTPIGQPSQLKPLKTKALSLDTGRASPGNHRKYLYMRHSATFCDIS